MLPDRPLHLTLEQTVKGFFLGFTDLLSQALDGDSTALVIRDLQVLVASDGA